MTEEIIYVTSYNKKPRKLQEEVLEDYSRECLICSSKEDVIITPVLSEIIYAELANETWNNILLCKNCKNMLEKCNNINHNGVRNLVKLVKQEDEKHAKWFNNVLKE